MIRPVTNPAPPADTEPDEAGPDRPTAAVRPWFDPELALRGVDPRSAYVEQFWLGIVGPSVVLLSRRLARGLELHPSGFSIDLVDTAKAIGLGGGTSPNSAIVRTIDRAAMFGFLRRNGERDIDVRTHVPVLTRRQLQRLPAALRRSHDAWAATSRSQPGDAA